MKEACISVAEIIGEIEISYRAKIKPSLRPKVKDANDVYKIFLDTWDKGKIEFVEQFKVMLLNRDRRVLGICTLCSGNATITIGCPRMVFAVALKANATEIIIAHNHPSGNLIPSSFDERLTKNLKTAGDFLDLHVIDHIIITTEGFYSFALQGAL